MIGLTCAYDRLFDVIWLFLLFDPFSCLLAAFSVVDADVYWLYLLMCTHVTGILLITVLLLLLDPDLISQSIVVPDVALLSLGCYSNPRKRL